MLGNAWEWCQSAYVAGQEAPEDTDDGGSVQNPRGHVLRGSSFFYQALHLRLSDRESYSPTDRSNDVGFRPSRTFTPWQAQGTRSAAGAMP